MIEYKINDVSKTYDDDDHNCSIKPLFLTSSISIITFKLSTCVEFQLKSYFSIV